MNLYNMTDSNNGYPQNHYSPISTYKHKAQPSIIRHDIMTMMRCRCRCHCCGKAVLSPNILRSEAQTLGIIQHSTTATDTARQQCTRYTRTRNQYEAHQHLMRKQTGRHFRFRAIDIAGTETKSAFLTQHRRFRWTTGHVWVGDECGRI